MVKGLKKSLGQHFLINDFVINNIVSLAPINEQSAILEIGCGNGALTKKITQKKYASYDIVEIDPRWAKYIFEEYKKYNVVVHEKSILDYDLSSSNKKYTIIGNLPYNITYKIMEWFLDQYNYIDNTIVCMIQDEVALKIAKKSGRDYGPISVFMQAFFDVSIHDYVVPEDFTPPPKVFSRVIVFKKLVSPKITSCHMVIFKKFLSLLFAFPRKKIKHVVKMYDSMTKGANYMDYTNYVSPTQNTRILSQNTKGLIPSQTQYKNIPTGSNYAFYNTPAMGMP